MREGNRHQHPRSSDESLDRAARVCEAFVENTRCGASGFFCGFGGRTGPAGHCEAAEGGLVAGRFARLSPHLHNRVGGPGGPGSVRASQLYVPRL